MFPVRFSLVAMVESLLYIECGIRTMFIELHLLSALIYNEMRSSFEQFNLESEAMTLILTQWT